MFTPQTTRRIALTVLVTFTSLTMQPLQAAIQLQDKIEQGNSLLTRQQPNRYQPQAPAQHEDALSRTLVEMDNLVKEIAPRAGQAVPVTGKTKADKRGKTAKGKAAKTRKVTRAFGPNMRVVVEESDQPLPGVDVAANIRQLRAKHKQLAALAAQAEQDFAATGRHLKDKNLPPEILSRHEAAIAEFQRRQSEYNSLLTAVGSAYDKQQGQTLQTAINDLARFMAAHPNQKTHTPSDPNKLPFGTPSGKVRAPIQTEKGFKTSLFKPDPLASMLAGPIPNGFTLPTTNLPPTPTAEDLAATEDIVLTPAIKAQAAALNNNPVQIYNWVRNNIEYLPTYGSIQGADMTLQTKRGNSFDTASLLIGLLRAANIPARYVYGTIQVPADQAMNWVGGVTKAEAAQQLMGQGGIPNIGIISGGTIKYIKLEHVWVEAYVDYVPSRGAVNKTPDSWIPMDASYKQYTYTQGMDLKTAVPLDAQALVTQAQAGATVDPSGWVQNVNSTAIQTALTSYQTQVQDYINTTKPNATVGDVIGSKTIVPENHSILMGTLPYITIATGGKFAALPNHVRHQFEYDLYASAMDRAMGSPTISLKQSLPSLAGKKITLSFAPATPADANLIASYLPAPNANGTPILPSQLPTSLPGYLIRLTAEMRVDGQVVATGGTFTMGEELVSSAGLFDPVNGWDFAEDNRPIAGEYIATHVDLQGVSTAQLQTLKDRMTATQAKLTAGQYTGISKEDLSGDILYSAVLDYFATSQASTELSQGESGMVVYRKPSFGKFETSAKMQYWFGIPRNISFPGLVMDIDRYVSIVVAKENSSTVGYMKQSGLRLSANEHLIPEKLFTNQLDPNRPQGVSAVKALALASRQGQRIFTLNQSNQAQHQTLLAQVTIDPQAMAEIQNGLAAGKEVTLHQSPITQSGWTGSGYIITDPGTGAGAYKIAGGANGGTLIIFAFAFVLMAIAIIIPALALLPIIAGGAAAVMTALSGAAIYLMLASLILAIDNFLTFIANINKANDFQSFNRAAAAASVDAMLDIFVASKSKDLLEFAAAKIELIALWAAIMCGQIAKVMG